MYNHSIKLKIRYFLDDYRHFLYLDDKLTTDTEIVS